MSRSSDAEMPVCENLIELINQAVRQYGSQKEAAEALSTTDSTISRMLKGDQFPKSRVLDSLVRFKSEVDGRSWNTRQLMAWLWQLPADEMPPEPTEIARIRTLLEDGIALLETGINTIATASEKLQAMGSQASQEKDFMCASLVRILSAALRDRGLDLSKDKDFKKLCATMNADPKEESALRLRAIVLGQETATQGDRLIISAALQALGDTTPAYALALDCQDC